MDTQPIVMIQPALIYDEVVKDLNMDPLDINHQSNDEFEIASMQYEDAMKDFKDFVSQIYMDAQG